MAVQQVVANDHSHLGVDVRAGREQQPGHLEAAAECDVQGRTAVLVMRTRADSASDSLNQ